MQTIFKDQGSIHPLFLLFKTTGNPWSKMLFHAFPCLGPDTNLIKSFLATKVKAPTFRHPENISRSFL